MFAPGMAPYSTSEAGDRLTERREGVSQPPDPRVDATRLDGWVPELPREYLDTRLAAVPAAPAARTIRVKAGDNLQDALDTARPGDVIALQPSATYVGTFLLRRKAGTGWITIRSAASEAALPPEGTRLTPQYASALPRLVSPSNIPVLRTEVGAHHYRIVAVEMTVAPRVTRSYNIVALGDASDAQRALASVPTDLVLDRVYVHGHEALHVNRCVALNSARTAVVDSWIAECHGKGFDSQAVAGWNGPGPFKIVNNYLEGAGESIIFGGADPDIPNLIPSDIEIRRNHITRPVSWKGVWTVKNLFELKNGQRVLVEGNVFGNHWADGQDGFAFVLKSVNQDGGCPWCVTRDVTIRYNVLHNSSGGINIAARPERHPAVPLNRILIEHNVFDQIQTGPFIGHGRLFQILGGPAGITIMHNTTLHAGSGANAAVVLDEARAERLVLRDNVMTRGEYGVFGGDVGEGIPALRRYTGPGSIFGRNVVIGAPSELYPADNFFPPDIRRVGFVDAAAGNYRLSPSSPYRGKATNGSAPGADIDALEQAISGVVIR